jgi:hypothetical protein
MPDPTDSLTDPAVLPSPLTLTIKPASATMEVDADKPLSFAGYLVVPMDEEKKRELARTLLTEIDDILSDRAELERCVKTYRRQYRQLISDTGQPWAGAYHLNTPVTTKQMDTAMAETAEVFEATDPSWTVQGIPNPALKDAIGIQQRTLDVYEDFVEGGFVSQKVFFDAWLLGTGWEARVFKHQLEHHIEQRTWSSIEEFSSDFPDHWQKHTEIVKQLSEGTPVTRVIEFTEDVIQAPISEHVEWEDAIVPLHLNGLMGLRTATCLARRVWMRWSEIQQLEQQGDYLSGVSEELKYMAGVVDESGYKTRGDYNPDYQRTSIETFEVTTFLMVGKKLVRCLVNIARDRLLVMRIIRYPYEHHRPFLIPYWIEESRAGIYQPGLGEKLQPINLALNGLLAHILNAGVLATSMGFKIRSNTDAIRAMFEKEWYPGAYTELSNMDDVQQWQFQMPNLDPMVKMFTILLSFAEDVTGITGGLGGNVDAEDPNAPGNKTALLLRRASKKLRKAITTLRQSVDESGYQALRLIAQFVPAKTVAQALGINEEEARSALRLKMPTVAHSAAFDLDRFQQTADNQLWFGLLSKEPLIVNNPIKRLKLYQMLAESQTTGWREKLDDLLPEEEIAALPPPSATSPRNPGGSQAILDRLTQRAIQAGKSPQEARQIAQMAMQRMTAMAGGGGGQGPPGQPPMAPQTQNGNGVPAMMGSA